MDEIRSQEADRASWQSAAPKNGPAAAKPLPQRAPFTASAREIAAALAICVPAYLYVCLWPSETPAEYRALLTAFALGFFALAEYLNRDRPRPRESWIWLGCAAVILAALVLRDGGRVWSENAFVFLHIFAVWWVLSRSGTLLAGESGSLLPLDALDAFFVFPFGNFFLRIRTLLFAAGRFFGARTREKPKAGTVLRSALAGAAALFLLVRALGLLMRADDGFAALLDGFAALLRFEWSDGVTRFLGRFAFSLPVGAYLYGLLGGTARAEPERLRERAANVEVQMQALRGVPERVWIALLALFCALYALFFAVQGQYLFGAFTRTLPEGFIVSEYARQGFFELCRVMAVNFALLWLVTRSSGADVRGQRAARALCLVLLAESLLLAVVALSKLALYIDCFGFTPKRLQSTWLACVLAFGCGCAAWWFVRGGKTFRAWMVFGAVTLSLLCLY